MDKDTADTLLFIIDRMIFAREYYDGVKRDPAERQKSTLLGRRALVYDIILLIFIGGAAFLTVWGIGMESGWKVLVFILAALIALAMIPFYILAFNFSIKQLCLNRRAIGWITLLLPIIITVAAAVCIAVFAM